MLSYIAVRWNPHVPDEIKAAALFWRAITDRDGRWKLAFESRGACVRYRGPSPANGTVVPIDGNLGVITDRLFHNEAAGGPSRRVTCLDETTAAEVIRTAGRSLIASHWGSYVLFLRDASSEDLVVFRGPMASLHCFWVNIGPLRVLFSSIEDFYALGLRQLSVNWDIVRAQSVGGDYLTRETGLNEISTIISGECVRFSADGGVRSELYWNPVVLAQCERIRDPREASELILQATRRSLTSWAREHKCLVLQYSGGFDSSVLLGCFMEAFHNSDGPPVIPATFWSPGAGDERYFARDMAKFAGAPLVEFKRAETADFSLFAKCARTGNPVLHFTGWDAEPRLIALAKSQGATAICAGELGDEVFAHVPAPEFLSECLSASPRLFQRTLDYAELRRMSFARAIHEAARYRLWQRRRRYWSLFEYRELLGWGTATRPVTSAAVAAYSDSLMRFIHPWVVDVTNMPTGMTILVSALINLTSTLAHSPFGGEDATLFHYPLAAQPLVEAFCRIPSWMHFHRGENGAVARAAFSRWLSPEVLGRGTGKGTPDMWSKGLIRSNREVLRKMLLDGVLAQAGILDRRKVSEVLSGTVSASRIPVPEIIRQLYIESWLRLWTNTPLAKAA